ncbi:MAG: hypothetical protein ACLQEQ_09860 [Nitrososphaerales archaeon]
MRNLQKRGMDFELLARDALKDKLGQGFSDIVFMSIGKAAREDPGYFVASITKMFGQGAVGILEPIVARADLGVLPTSEASQLALLEAYIREHPSKGGSGGLPPMRLLHDHRIRDEHGNLIDEDD